MKTRKGKSLSTRMIKWQIFSKGEPDLNGKLIFG